MVDLLSHILTGKYSPEPDGNVSLAKSTFLLLDPKMRITGLLDVRKQQLSIMSAVNGRPAVMILTCNHSYGDMSLAEPLSPA